MAGIVLFLVVHVALVTLLVPSTLLAMVVGRATEPRHAVSDRRTRDDARDGGRLLRGGLSLGALTLLTGCDLSDDDAVQRVLARFSAWNDRVQAALFSEQRLAPTFPEAMAVKDFRYNAWYGAGQGADASIRPTTGCSWPAGSPTSGPGRSMNSMRCRRSARSRAMSASRAGA